MNRRELFQVAAAIAALPAAETPKKARLKPALCAYSFRDQLKDKSMSHDDLVRVAVEADVDGIDLTVYWFPNTSDEFLLPLKRLAYRNAIEIYSIAIRTEMTQPTAELREKELAGLKQWVDVAERLGAGHIRVFGGRVPKGASEDEAAGWVVETLKRGAEYAGAKGIILGLENHGGITEKAARIVDIVKKVDSPWVGVNLDTGNFTTQVFQQIETVLPYAVNFQVKSEMREDGKRGPSDWDRVLKMAAASGYRGYLALEYEAREPAPTAVPRLLARLRELCRKYSA